MNQTFIKMHFYTLNDIIHVKIDKVHIKIEANNVIKK